MNPAALVCVFFGIVFLGLGWGLSSDPAVVVAPVAYFLASVFTVVGIWASMTGRGER